MHEPIKSRPLIVQRASEMGSVAAPEGDFVFADGSSDCVWGSIRRGAQEMASEQPITSIGYDLLVGILESSLLRWDSLEEALAAVLAYKLSSESAPKDRWQRLLSNSFSLGFSSSGDSIQSLIRKDLLAIQERDPACPSLCHAFLYFKGFHGLQVYRAANWMWQKGQKSVASALQSRTSEVFGVDIHPAAQIGWGVMIDHATGVVIGETARMGNGCTLLHGVTLGGNGKQQGVRHPKLGTNVLVGAGASILGNVEIGDGAKIGASAVVLTNIPAFATAVGCPAKVIGRAKEQNPASVLDHCCKLVELYTKRNNCLCPFRHLESSKPGFLGPHEFVKRLQESFGVPVPVEQAMTLFFELDTDHDGQLKEVELEKYNSLLTKVLSSR